MKTRKAIAILVLVIAAAVVCCEPVKPHVMGAPLGVVGVIMAGEIVNAP